MDLFKKQISRKEFLIAVASVVGIFFSNKFTKGILSVKKPENYSNGAYGGVKK